jgi:hypothetical protein
MHENNFFFTGCEPQTECVGAKKDDAYRGIQSDQTINIYPFLVYRSYRYSKMSNNFWYTKQKYPLSSCNIVAFLTTVTMQAISEKNS